MIARFSFMLITLLILSLVKGGNTELTTNSSSYETTDDMGFVSNLEPEELEIDLDDGTAGIGFEP